MAMTANRAAAAELCRPSGQSINKENKSFGEREEEETIGPKDERRTLPRRRKKYIQRGKGIDGEEKTISPPPKRVIG